MQKYCYLNRKITPEEKASVSIKDLGLLRGYAVFDFLRTYNGWPFFLSEHLNRLANSAKLVGLKVPISKSEISKMIKKLLKINKLNEATIKIIVTGGISKDGLAYDKNSSTIIIITKELPPHRSEIYKKGIKLITHDFQRNNSGAKTTDYITMLKLQNKRMDSQAFEVLYTNNGLVLEGSTSNIFIFKNNTLITPKNNILAGITRKVVIKLAARKFKVEERDIKVSEIKKATGAFITSTTREILPVVKIDNTKIGGGRVDKNTQWLIGAFRSYTDRFDG
jgi:branched-chain amino acid aminotransferase